MATIQDVAHLANVSVATVSRVLNNSNSVKPDTQHAVMEAIRKLGYQPNLLGRNLRRLQTKMVLVLLPTISNTFYSKIVQGIEDVGHKNGYNVMICTTGADVQREQVYLELLKNRLADGIIFMAPQIDAVDLSEIGKNYHVVQCCEYKEGAEVSRVSIDNSAAAYEATQHLIKLGHRKIGFISSNSGFLSASRREEGYKAALRDAGIELNPGWIQYGDYGFKSGLRVTKGFLQMDEPPTAIFAISDMMAIGAVRAIEEHGLRVPDDVAVMGFDNISFAAMYDPRLTTISQPQYDMGSIAMNMLLDQIKGKEKKVQQIILEHELVIRESTIK